MENKFKIGDWIISTTAREPMAYRCCGFSQHSILLDLPRANSSYSKEDIDKLRIAYQSEIPLEYRNKHNYYFY